MRVTENKEERAGSWGPAPVSLSAQSRLCLNVLVASRMRRPETADSWAAQLSADDPETAPGAESPADGAAEARCPEMPPPRPETQKPARAAAAAARW